jgi:tRNA-splicing ligase RtcB (3'-phosphate/5'-hydroxy nucleic acid ligase)
VPEAGALKQALNLANLPFVFKHVCLMPDTHQGYGMPIGGVVACEGMVIPNGVGVDIGCGMVAVKTSLESGTLDKSILKKIMGHVREAIPIGFNHHKTAQNWDGFHNAPQAPVIQRELKSAHYQLGTLGGGNHFIEIQKDENGKVWFMVHSGSRNFGLKIAKEYNDIAQKLCAKKYKDIDVGRGESSIAFLPVDSKEGEEYLAAMNFALRFALESRKRMMERLTGCVREVLDFKAEQEVNIHHNYATQETHFGRKVVVHRKGATSAKLGEWGIIPGSQGTHSYIVKGKGNPESFMSCSHGAGRKMSRHEAQRSLSLVDEIKKMDDLGIVHGIRTKKDLDEAAGAYKDIDVVMEEQADLAEIVFKLAPLAVIKA